MNILLPDSWLREFVETQATPKELKESLSLCGPSVERINRVGDEIVYDIEITSNRIDMASAFGIAREAAAILPRFGIHANLKPLRIDEVGKDPGSVPIEIRDNEHLCDRLMAIVLTDVTVGPSPGFIKDRLELSGIRSLNNVIDITNYVMLELGHPCHVFDFDRIKTSTLSVRYAQNGEILTTLDGKTHKLVKSDVVIDDGTGRIIDLPGIMGTQNSVIEAKTKNVLLFIEANNPQNIRRTSMRLAIRSVAATINEKHPDPYLAKTAFDRAINLLTTHANAKIASKYIDQFPNKPQTRIILVSDEFIQNRLGITLDQTEIIEILRSLSFTVAAKGVMLEITPPTFRQFDIEIPEDIVEEVARLYGYHNFPVKLMAGDIPLTPVSKDLTIESGVKSLLKNWGYTETYHYSFVSSKLLKLAALKEVDHLRVSNPLTEDTEYMRTSLVPQMLDSVSKNQNFTDSVRLFEIAKIYRPLKSSLPQEISMLLCATNDDFWHLKGIITSMLAELGITDYEEKTGGTFAESQFFHPLISLEVNAKGRRLAVLGRVHPHFASIFGLRNDLNIASVYMQELVSLSSDVKKYSPISPYPAIIEDLTFIFPDRTPLGKVIKTITNSAPFVKKVLLIGRFAQKATFRIHFQSKDSNLTSDDCRKYREKIIDEVKREFSGVFEQ